MAGLRRRVGKLEQEAATHIYEVLTLPDGSTIRYEPEELFEVLSAVLDNREHRLLPALRSVGSNQGMLGLIRALESSKARRDGDEPG